MKKSQRISTFLQAAAIVGSLTVLSPGNVAAQDSLRPGLSTLVPVGPFLLRFDENGHATIAVNRGPETILTGTLAPDPTTPLGVGQQLVLTFMLPEPVVTGDVSFTELGANGPSDWLRFTDAAGHISGVATGDGPRMIFYSEFELGETHAALADKRFPDNLGKGNFLAQLEVGVEGNNGFDYRPGAAYPSNNEYIGISDAVPEPETYALMLAGLASLGLVVRRRKQG